MPLIQTDAVNLQAGQVFFAMLNTYRICNDEESQRHPAKGRYGVLAYCIPNRGPKVPVRFAPDCKVFVEATL